MSMHRDGPRALRWLLSVATVAFLLVGMAPLQTAANARAQEAQKIAGKKKNVDWKNVTLIYTTDVKGKIEPCG